MTSPIPNLPQAGASTTDDVLVATPDIVLFDEENVPVEVMTDLVFENIGGQELINIIRNDIVNGQNVIYKPIKNLSILYLQYNPQNILALQDASESYFKNFPIKLENKVPRIGTGPNGEIVYLDPETGDIIINVINLARDEEVEVQIIDSVTLLDGTIYEAEL